MTWTDKKASKLYAGTYRHSEGRRRSAGTWPHKARAMRGSAAEAGERERPSPTDAQRITWAEWDKRWSATRSVAKSTLATDERRIRLWLMPTWSTKRLRDITPEHVQRWVTQLHRKHGKAPATVQRCYWLLSASMRAAVAARLITVSPCREIHMPAPAVLQERYLTDDEVAAILEQLHGPVELPVRVLVGTGLRWGEMVALHWQSVDLPRGTLDAIHSWDPIGREVEPPKTHQRRTVPLGADLANRLRTLPLTGATSCGQQHADNERCRSGLVIPSRRVCPLTGRGQPLPGAGNPSAATQGCTTPVCTTCVTPMPVEWSAQVCRCCRCPSSSGTARSPPLGGTPTSPPASGTRSGRCSIPGPLPSVCHPARTAPRRANTKSAALQTLPGWAPAGSNRRPAD